VATPGTRIESVLSQRPALAAVVALAVGILLGPSGLRMLHPQLLDDGAPVETIAEIALLLCLFCVGLRVHLPMRWPHWRIPLRLSTLATLAMTAMTAAAAHLFFDLRLVQSLLLGAILAPTDPVLALDAAPHFEGELDPPAAILSAESGINNGLAAALVVLVLGLMGLSDSDTVSLGSLSLSVMWSIAGAAAVGWLIGALMSRWMTLLDPERQAEYLGEAMVFATAALAYGSALAVHTDGFLAVFAAGVALSHGGRLLRPTRNRPLMPRVLRMARQVERCAWLAILVLLGALVTVVDFRPRMLVFAVVVLLVMRPVAVRLGLGGLDMPEAQWRGVVWFTARSMAPLYCLAFAIDHGLSQAFARELAGITLVVVVTSILASAIAALPLSKASPGAVDSG
jgi:sodium/hydrogen antiporter